MVEDGVRYFELPYDTYLTGNEVVQYFIEKDRAKIVKATDELRYKKNPTTSKCN